MIPFLKVTARASAQAVGATAGIPAGLEDALVSLEARQVPRGYFAGLLRVAAPLGLSAAMATTLLLAPVGAAAQAPQPAPPATGAPSTPQSTPQAPAPGTQPGGTTGGTDKPGSKPAARPMSEPAKPSEPVPLQANVGANGVVTGVKPGTIDDVNAVGTRNIGARGMGNWYSTESEIRMGKQYSVELEKGTRFINDPVVTEYVNRIGQNLVRNSDAKVPFTIRVIDSDEVNAMALPGGFFYVNSGLILNADEEAELAGVMAHEIAHVAAHHAARELTRLNYAQIGMVPLIFVGGYVGYGIYEAAQIGIPLTFLQFSRDFEAQADYLGVQYMYRAGYDPQAFVTFFEKIQNLEKRKPGAVAKAFSSHPQTPDRIETSQEEIAHILPPRPEYLVTTSEFDDVKARLARIENKRKLTDPKGSQKPTLRRVGTSDPNSTTADPNAPSQDDKPTLHKRDDSNP
ncbi:MAG TPA: M48 family metallopeptidase [Acidobacteriaceae bacterium]